MRTIIHGTHLGQLSTLDISSARESIGSEKGCTGIMGNISWRDFGIVTVRGSFGIGVLVYVAAIEELESWQRGLVTLIFRENPQRSVFARKLLDMVVIALAVSNNIVVCFDSKLLACSHSSGVKTVRKRSSLHPRSLDT